MRTAFRGSLCPLSLLGAGSRAFLLACEIVGKGIDFLGEQVIGLSRVIRQIILLVNRLISDHADLVIVLAGCFVNNFVLVESVNHVDQAGFHNIETLAEAFHHKFQSLSRPDHAFVIPLLSQQPFGFLKAFLYALPAAGIYIVCAHKTSPLPLNFYTVIII